jgi:integrase/recombinase XerD
MEVVMLEHYFRRPSTVDRIRANWLAPQIEHYVEWMHAQNYAAHNILRRVPLLCHFADFAREKGATDLNSATSFVETFASHWVARANCKNAVTRRNLIQSAILQMLRLALEGCVTQNRPPKRFLLQSEAPGFFRYLREERGFCEGVISRYLRYLNRFALYLRRVGVTSLSELSAPLLSSFVIDTAPGLARTTTAYLAPSKACGGRRWSERRREVKGLARLVQSVPELCQGRQPSDYRNLAIKAKPLML